MAIKSCRSSLSAFSLFAGLLLVVESKTAQADSYPVQLTGAWGGRAAFMGDDNPKVAAAACESYKKNPKAVIGDLLVFHGSQKYSYGGYADYVDKNISVKQVGADQWEITDRHYHDGEGGGRTGYKSETYRIRISGGVIALTMGKDTIRYSKCASDQPLRANPEIQASPKAEEKAAQNLPRHAQEPIVPDASFAKTPGGMLRANAQLNEPITWPLGPSVRTSDDGLNNTFARLRAAPGKNDILGLSPGMTYDEALNVLKSMKDISRTDGRCEVFAFSAEIIAEFSKRGQSLSCSTSDGRLEVVFTPQAVTKRVTSVELDFPSGATSLEMVDNVTSRFGGVPKDVSLVMNCDGVRADGFGGTMAAYSKANGEYDRCLSENKMRKNSVVRWMTPNGLSIILERQEKYYDESSKLGFKLILESLEASKADQKAGRESARNQNSEPELTQSKKELIGIVPGMHYDQIVQHIKSYGYYIRPLSQSPLVDVLGGVRPYCSDPDEISNRRGSRLKCYQGPDQEFELEFEFTMSITPPILSSVQLNFVSGSDEMTAYVADQFGALPSAVKNYQGVQTAVWSLPGDLVLNLQQKERNKWSISLSDLSISEADKKARNESQKTLNVRPKF